MNAEIAIVHILQNDATYSAIVGDGTQANARVYYDQIEQGSPYPNCVVTCETVDPTDTKQNSNFDHDLIQVFHSANDKAQSINMANACRSALETVRNTAHNGITVNEIRFVDGDSFSEKVVDNQIWTIEQIFRVTINR